MIILKFSSFEPGSNHLGNISFFLPLIKS